MKYSIEITGNECIETLELYSGKKYEKRSKRTNNGLQLINEEFTDQLKEDGFPDEVLDVVYDLFDESFLSVEFAEFAAEMPW